MKICSRPAALDLGIRLPIFRFQSLDTKLYEVRGSLPEVGEKFPAVWSFSKRRADAAIVAK